MNDVVKDVGRIRLRLKLVNLWQLRFLFSVTKSYWTSLPMSSPVMEQPWMGWVKRGVAGGFPLREGVPLEWQRERERMKNPVALSESRRRLKEWCALTQASLSIQLTPHLCVEFCSAARSSAIRQPCPRAPCGSVPLQSISWEGWGSGASPPPAHDRRIVWTTGTDIWACTQPPPKANPNPNPNEILYPITLTLTLNPKPEWNPVS